MQELIPITIGVAIALACRQIADRGVRTLVTAALAIVGAAIASMVNGEQGAWPLLLAFDLLLVSTGVMAGRVGLGLMAHRARERRAL